MSEPVVVPPAVLRRWQPFLYGPRSEKDWPIEAHRGGRSSYWLFLQPAVAEALYGDGSAFNCAGGLVAALGDVTPLPFENAAGEELGALCKIPVPELGEALMLFGSPEALTCLSWWLRREGHGFYVTEAPLATGRQLQE